MIESHALYLATSAALFLSLLLTPLVRDAFLRLNILDLPDGERKLHRSPIPRIGGVAITFSYVGAYGLLLVVRSHTGSFVESQLPFIVRLLPALSTVFVTGLLDDVFGLRPWQKLAGQTAGALLAVLAGVQISGVAGHPIESWMGVPLTVLWLVGCANAFNLVDGLDGLAAGMGLLATLAIFLAALLHGNEALVLATGPLAGAILGFLRYNFNPASAFLGDSGSLLIGFLLGSYGVIWSQKSATLLGMMAPVMALAVPLLDTGLAMVRRWLRCRPVFGADRHHIHHKLLDRGLTHRGVVVVLYAVCSVCAALSLLQSMAEDRYAGLAVVIFCALTWAGVQRLGYHEFRGARRAVFGGNMRRLVHGHIVVHTCERAFLEASSVQDYWGALERLGEEFGFSVQARLHGCIYERRPEPAAQPNCWQLRMPLAREDYILLTCPPESRALHGLVMPVLDILFRAGSRLALLPAGEPTGRGSLLALARAAGDQPRDRREAGAETAGIRAP